MAVTVPRRNRASGFLGHHVGGAFDFDEGGPGALEVRELRDGVWTVRAVHGDEERVRIPPYEAIEIPLARMWLPDSVP